MSLSSIITSLNDAVSNILGNNWQELQYIYQLEDNTFRSGDSRFGVGVNDGSSVAGTNKAVTLDFSFFVVLTKTFVNRSNDISERASISDIYDQFDSINKNIFQKKLNNVNILLVQDINFEAPERVDTSTISVKCNYTIKYRSETT